MTQMALEGADLIFTTSFGYMDPTINVAKKFPNVKFEHATGYKTRRQRLGLLGSFLRRPRRSGPHRWQNDQVQHHRLYRFLPDSRSDPWHQLGLYPRQEGEPGCRVSRLSGPTRGSTPAKEADAATVLIEQGADVILQHTDSTAPQAAAQEAGNVITFGQASDMSEYAPLPRVSSIIDNWAPYYIARTKAVMDGTWTSSNTWDGIGAGMVEIGEISDAVPAGRQRRGAGPEGRRLQMAAITRSPVR